MQNKILKYVQRELDDMDEAEQWKLDGDEQEENQNNDQDDQPKQHPDEYL